MAAQDREQLKIELQQVNQQINQQTQMRSMEVCPLTDLHQWSFSFAMHVIRIIGFSAAVKTPSALIRRNRCSLFCHIFFLLLPGQSRLHTHPLRSPAFLPVTGCQ